MHDPDTVDPRYRAMELHALGTLCTSWTGGAFSDKIHPLPWKRRLQYFRDGVIAGRVRGFSDDDKKKKFRTTRQHIPTDILRAELLIHQKIIEQLRGSVPLPEENHVINVELTIQASQNLQSFSFPAPLTEFMYCSLAKRLSGKGRPTIDGMAKGVLENRYNIARRWINDALKMTTDVSLTDLQALGIHFYSTLAIATNRLDDQARLLDFLQGVGVPPIVLYYLIQHAQRVPHLELPCPNDETISDLCHLASSTNHDYTSLPQST